MGRAIGSWLSELPCSNSLARDGVLSCLKALLASNSAPKRPFFPEASSQPKKKLQQALHWRTIHAIVNTKQMSRFVFREVEVLF